MVLTAADRCDAKECGAQGIWSTWFGFSQLVWCNHHFVEYETKLRDQADAIMDHRELA